MHCLADTELCPTSQRSLGLDSTAGYVAVPALLIIMANCKVLAPSLPNCDLTKLAKLHSCVISEDLMAPRKKTVMFMHTILRPKRGNTVYKQQNTVKYKDRMNMAEYVSDTSSGKYLLL